MLTVEWCNYNYCWHIYESDANWISRTKEELNLVGLTPRKITSEFDTIGELKQYERDFYEAYSTLLLDAG